MRARLPLLLLFGLLVTGAATAREDWPNYEVILWQRQPDAAYATLPRLGYSGGLVFGMREGFEIDKARRETAPLRAAGLRWYVENIATDFYSAYHRWTAGKPVNWRFLEQQARHRANPNDPALFLREPGLGDPAWRARIAARLAEHAREHLALAAPGRPFFLNLGDEPGIADLSAEWDFDRSPASLVAFRAWLRPRYPSLEALNASWGSSFPAWESITPPTTDQMIAGPSTGFAGWVAFKAFMDEEFAAALAAGREAVRAVDPNLPVGIAGGQAPGPGGWDYGLLGQAVDLIESYDIAGSLAIARGLNPEILLLSTSFNVDAAEWHRLWRQVLLGVRGSIVWEEGQGVVAADGTPGPRGLASAPRFTALRDGLPALLFASTPAEGPVGILYSQPSFRLRWLLDRRAEARAGGPSWAARGAEAEYLDENAWRVALRHAIDGLAAAGVTPRWLRPEALAAGVPVGLRLLVLPHAIALGDAEVAAIRTFVAGGGIVVSDTDEAGAFDAHGRPRPAPPLAGLPLHPLPTPESEASAGFAPLLAMAGAMPPFRLDGPPGLEARLYRNGAVTLLALHAAKPPESGAAPWPVTVRLPAPAELRQLETATPATRRDSLALPLDPVLPAVLAWAPRPLPGLEVTRRGQGVRLGLTGPSPAALHVLRLELLDAAGAASPERRWVVRLSAGETLDWQPPAGTPPGPLRVTDILSGAVRTLPDIR